MDLPDSVRYEPVDGQLVERRSSEASSGVAAHIVYLLTIVDHDSAAHHRLNVHVSTHYSWDGDVERSVRAVVTQFMNCRLIHPLLPAVTAMVLLALQTVCGGSQVVPQSKTLAAPAGAIRPFLEQHCLECHDDTEQKGGLRLDNLPAEFSDPDVQRTWIDVFDKLSAGEMPPKKKPRPSSAEISQVLIWLKSGITSADVARRNVSGRVVLRRLNRNEYQNTIRDLLHVDVDVKDLLPADTPSMGFDNIAAALNVSSVLLERYLEAADTALDAAIQTGPRPPLKTWDVPYGVVTNNPKDYRLKTGNRSLEDGTWVIFNSGDVPVTCDRFKAPAEGRYRFRVSGYAYHSPGKPLSMSIMAGSFDPKLPKRETIGFFDLPPTPDNPRTIEFTQTLPRNGTFKIMAHRIGRRSFYPDDGKWQTYEGPGVAISRVHAEGPLNDVWPPESQTSLFGKVDAAHGTPADADGILQSFAARAFRRPVDAAEVRPYTALVKAQLDANQPFVDSVRVGLKAILCSPEFLFLREQPGKLDDYAIASRLSYFLWSSTPDEQLLKLAAAGTLTRPDVLRGQTRRMLQDPKANAFTEDFTGQWLNLRQIDFTSPDKRLYPDFDEMLQWSMVEETHRFFNEVLSNDLSVTNFIDSDFAIINNRLADLYDIPGVTGAEFRKVPLPPGTHRGGVLTQASVLKVTANGTNTSPVVRGAWVMRNILGHPPKPPPPDVPAIEPDTRGATTIRELLEKHRANPTCAACHAGIDPPGFALESFDVIGGWRENYRTMGGNKTSSIPVDGKLVAVRIGPKVDPASTMPDGRSFQTFDEFKKLLVGQQDQFARCLTEKLLVYATGAGLDFADRDSVTRVMRNARREKYGFRSLIEEVVLSDVFLNK